MDIWFGLHPGGSYTRCWVKDKNGEYENLACSVLCVLGDFDYTNGGKLEAATNILIFFNISHIVIVLGTTTRDVLDCHKTNP